MMDTGKPDSSKENLLFFSTMFIYSTFLGESEQGVICHVYML